MTWRRATGLERCGYCGTGLVRNDVVCELSTHRFRCCGCVSRHHPGAPAIPELPLLRDGNGLDASVLTAQMKRVASGWQGVRELASQTGFFDHKAAASGEKE